MENKFCLKSKKELDEIRKQKAEAKKQVNEISDRLAESKMNETDKRLVVPNRPKLKSLADDIVDLGVETAKSIGHALTGDIFRKRRKPVVSEASNSGTMDRLLKLVTQISYDYSVHYEPNMGKYSVEDDNTGDILVSGTPTKIRKWAEENGAKPKARNNGGDFNIDGAETLDQVYKRNWDRVVREMNKPVKENFTASEALQESRKILGEISDKTIQKVTRRRSQELNKAHKAVDASRNPETIANAIEAERKMKRHFELAKGKGFSATDVFAPESEEYKQLKDFADKVAEKLPDAKVEVKDVWFDYGQKWEWTTIIITLKNGQSYQAIDPSQQETILLGEPKEIDTVADRVVKEAEDFLKNENYTKRAKSRKILGEISDELANKVKTQRQKNYAKATREWKKVAGENPGVFETPEQIDKWNKATIHMGKEYEKKEKNKALNRARRRTRTNESYDKGYEEEYYQHLKSDPKLYDLGMLQDSKSYLIAKAGALTDKDVAELNAVARRLKELQGKNESKINEEIQGNNLNSKWVIRAWMDNMDSEDGYDEIEFTKIGLIDFINSEEEDYYGDSYDYQAEPVEYDITDEELKTAINDNVFAWVFGDTASVVSIDGKPVNESKIDEDDKYYHSGKDGELLTPDESNNKMCQDTITVEEKASKNGDKYFTASYTCGELNISRNGKTEELAREALKKVLKAKYGIDLNESMFNKYGEEVDPKEWKNKEARGLNEAKSNEVNIFLTNLGKYNEGELVGEWVKLPVDDFQPILDRIGINDEYEEWFITDYEAPFEINEYDDIEELNDIAREIQDFNSIQLEVLDAYKENGYDMRDAIDKVIEYDYFYLEGNTEEDLAYSYIDAVGSFEDAVSKEDKQYYFDYEAYGRDLVLGGDYSYVDDAVDLNSFADKDTAIAIFGDYGEDLPSEDDIAKYKKWIEIYNNYTDEQEEELAKQGIEVFMSSLYVDGVAYDVETLEQVVGEDYEVQSGYKDYEGNIVDVSSEKELAEYVIDDLFGGVDQLGDEEIERYFDYAWWGKTLSYDFYRTDNGWVQLY